MEIAYVAAAVAGAGVIGLLGPRVIARIPEPPVDPDDRDEEPKALYVDLAARSGLALRLGALAAVLMLVVSSGIEEPLLLPAWAVFAGVGSWLSYIDLRTRLLPYALTLPLHVVALALVGLASLVAMDRTIVLKALIGNLVVYAVFRLIYALGRWISQPFGFGDVRIAGVIGLLLGALGAQATLYGTYAGFILGAVVGLGLFLTGRIGRRDPFAFGPYLVVGAFVGPAVAALV